MNLAEKTEVFQALGQGKRILVAEDSPVTQDLLELVLTQRGHHVDIVTDGEAALAALIELAYDIAFLDYRLPKLDGLDVALKFGANKRIKSDLRIIAITADTDSLRSRDGAAAAFEQIIPKPFDINEILTLVDGEVEISDHVDLVATGSPMHDGLTPADHGGARYQVEGMDHTFLKWPEDFDATTLAERARGLANGEVTIDAVLVPSPASAANLAALWRHKALHLLPVIDLTGSTAKQADLDVSRLKYGQTAAVQDLIRSFHRRRDQIHRDILLSADMGEKLLGRIFVTENGLQASHDPNHKSLVSYNTTLPNKTIASEAAKLCERGLLQREFFDRAQICGQCGGSRFNVREECSKCRSPNLSEDNYLHHFKCAYQGPEADFRHQDDLICPKCRMQLSHFSVDYDKPGAFMTCVECSTAMSDPVVGFVCLDCGTHSDSEAVTTKNIYSFILTDQGRAMVEVGRDLLGPAQQSLRFSELPLEFVVALNREAKRFNEDETPFAVAEISYRNERDLVREIGYRQFSQARKLFVDNLRSQLGSEDVVKMGQAYDFALLKGTGQYEARTSLNDVQVSASDTLRHDLGISINVFGPQDFA